jgi:branched-chain amino acid transport system substrate-binding protein
MVAKRPVSSPGLAVFAVMLLAACTLINGGFDECTVDQQCGGSRVCIRRTCLPMPAQCRRDVGAFDRADSIRIAAILPLASLIDGGADPRGGTDLREVARLNAMELAVKDVNESAGINNRRFSLYVCNSGRQQQALLVEQATWAVTQLGVPAVITSGSTATLAAFGISELIDAGTMIVSPSATSAELIGAFAQRGTTWRVAPPDTLQAQVMVNTLLSEPEYSGATGIAVLYEDNPYGRGFSSILRDRLRTVGKNSDIFGYPKVEGTVIDVARLRSSLEAFHGRVDAGSATPSRATVIIGAPSEITPIITSTAMSSTLSYDAGHRWFFSDSAKQPLLVTQQTLPEITEALGTTPAQGTGIAFADFRSRYRDLFGIEASDFSFTAHSYDAAFLIMLCAAYAARDNGAVTGPRMSEGIAKLSLPTGSDGGMSFQLKPTAWREASSELNAGRPINVEGASGQLDFDLDAGAPSSPYEIWQVTDAGALRTVRLVNP